MDINDAIGRLTQALTNTKEFIELKQARAVINSSQKSVEVLEKLQKKQELIYNGSVSQDKLPQYMKEVDSDYRTLSQIPEIGRYFTASEDFSRLITNVFNEINSSVEKKM